MIRKQQRPGITLVEVLTAIFVMAIGLLALLVLFPLGVLRMSQAIQDDRTMHLATNAEAICLLGDLRHDTRFNALLHNPELSVPPPADPSDALRPADVNGPSYPVYVDPVGMRASAQDWIGNQPRTIRRATSDLAWVDTNGDNIKDSLGKDALLRWFYLLDDIESFDKDGNAIDPTSTKVERGNRYSWACMVQRPKNGNPAIVDLSVVVYVSRPVTLEPTNLSLGEFLYNNVVFDLASNTVFVPATSGTPEVRVGGWILDATKVDGQAYLTESNYPHSHGKFYRVVAINPTTDTMGNPGVELELEQTIRGFQTNGVGRIFTLDGVAEVFEKRIGWKP